MDADSDTEKRSVNDPVNNDASPSDFEPDFVHRCRADLCNIYTHTQTQVDQL